MTEVKGGLFKEQVVQNLIEDGEENLHKVYSPVQSTKSTRILVAIDCGSTQTRVKLVDLEGAQDYNRAIAETYIIPSDYVFLTKASGYIPDSKILYDNMFVKLINTDNPNEGTVRSGFILRGNLAEKQNTSKSSIGSSGQKIKNPVLYYNLIDAIGYALMQHFDKEVPRKVDILLSVALPPQDNTRHNVAFLKQSLVSFMWTHISKVSVEMKFENVCILTEPEAQAKAKQVLSGGEDDLTEQRKLTIEIGGRSIGLNIMKGYFSIPDTQKTLDYGGKTIIDSIVHRFEEEYGMQVKPAAVRKALKTGVVEMGNSSYNIVHIIKEVKDLFAARIAADVRTVCFDYQNTVTPPEITDVEISGRTVLPGDYDYSLSTPLINELARYITNAEYEILDDNLIPLGLLLTAVHRFGLAEGDKEEVLSFDDEDFGSSEEVSFDEEETVPAQQKVAASLEVAASEESVAEKQPGETISEEDSAPDLDIS